MLTFIQTVSGNTTFTVPTSYTTAGLSVTVGGTQVNFNLTGTTLNLTVAPDLGKTVTVDIIEATLPIKESFRDIKSPGRKNFMKTPPRRLVNFFSATDMGTTGQVDSFADDDVSRMELNGSRRFTPKSANSYVPFTLTGGATDWTTVSHISLSFYIPDCPTSGNPYFQIIVSNLDTFGANYKQHSFTLTSALTVKRGWNYLKVRLTEANGDVSALANTVWSSVGTGLDQAQAVTKMRLQFYNLSGVPIWIEGLYADSKASSKLVWTFDNFGTDHRDVMLPLFRKYGWAGGACAIIDGMDGHSFSATGVKTLNAYSINRHSARLKIFQQALEAGWDVNTDDILDRNFAQVTDQSLIDFGIKENLSQFEQLGLSNPGMYHWILNNNAHSPAVLASMYHYGIKSVRGGAADWRYTDTDGYGLAQAMPDNPLIYGAQSWDNTTVAFMKAQIDEAIARGSHLFPYNHKIFTKAEALASTGVAVNATEKVSEYVTRVGVHSWFTQQGVDALSSWGEDLEEVGAYIRTKEEAGLMEVLKPSAFYDRMNNPEVSAIYNSSGNLVLLG